MSRPGGIAHEIGLQLSEADFEFVVTGVCEIDVEVEGSGSEVVRTVANGNGTVRTIYSADAGGENPVGIVGGVLDLCADLGS